MLDGEHIRRRPLVVRVVVNLSVLILLIAIAMVLTGVVILAGVWAILRTLT